MRTKVNSRVQLNMLAADWDRQAKLDKRDFYNYTNTLRELLFHADLRFAEYIQFETQEGPFIARLARFLENVGDRKQRQTLLKLVSLLDFFDRGQFLSLYRDAYRRFVVPWLTVDYNSADMLSVEFESRLRSEIKAYRLYSITESFDSSQFINKNSLSDLVKFDVLSEEPEKAITRLPAPDSRVRGLIILEDFVGTGNQSKKVLHRIASYCPSWRILFVPLIILAKGRQALTQDPGLSAIQISPVLEIGEECCVEKNAQPNERDEHPYLRALVKATASRVLKPFGEHDDQPENEFGYGGVGALLVTYHNTPNNTVPLVHHRGPDWHPLFRRVHHSKDGL